MREQALDRAEGRVGAHLAVGGEPDTVAGGAPRAHLLDWETAVMPDAPNVEIPVPVRAVAPCAAVDRDIRVDLVDHVAEGLHLVDDGLFGEEGFV